MTRFWIVLSAAVVLSGCASTGPMSAADDSDATAEAPPPRIRDLLIRCLQKDRSDRLRDIGDAWPLLDESAEAAIYRLLDERLQHTTIVSIGHRSTLSAFHRRGIALVRDGDFHRMREAGLAPAE